MTERRGRDGGMEHEREGCTDELARASIEIQTPMAVTEYFVLVTEGCETGDTDGQERGA